MGWGRGLLVRVLGECVRREEDVKSRSLVDVAFDVTCRVVKKNKIERKWKVLLGLD